MIEVILDEGIPYRLAKRLSGDGLEAVAFPADWQAVSDRELFERIIRDGFDILVAQDRNMPSQRPLSALPFAVLIVPELDRRRVLDLGAPIAARLPNLEKGRYALLGRDGSLLNPPTKPL